MTNISRLLVTIASIVMLVGCIQSIPCKECYQPNAYAPPALPEGSVAVVYGIRNQVNLAGIGVGSTMSINIGAADGVNLAQIRDGEFVEKLWGMPVKVSFKEGKHKLGIYYMYKDSYTYNGSGSSNYRYDGVDFVEGYLRAGRKYQISYKALKVAEDTRKFEFWLEDMGTSYTPPEGIFKMPPREEVFYSPEGKINN